MFPNKDWKHVALKMLIDTTGTVDRQLDSGRPRTVHTTAIIHQVEDVTKPVRKAAYTQNCVLSVCGILSNHFTPYYLFQWKQKINEWSN